MLKKYKGFTLKEHQDSGKKLEDISEFFLDLSIKLQRSYGKTSKTIVESAKLIKNIRTSIQELQDQMEDRLANEHPNLSDSEVVWYYHQRPRSQNVLKFQD